MKRKVWDITIKGSTNRAAIIENDEFYTTDTEAFLVFNLQDKFFVPQSAMITLENRNDGSLKSEEVEVVGGNIKWEMPERYIEHFGNWQVQIVYETKESGQIEKYTSGVMSFNVNSHIGDKKKPSLVEIENWEKFIADGTELIETWEDMEDLRQANEAQRQANYQELLDTGVLQTNINTKLEALEEEYAPKLTEVTAQLAQKATKKELNTTNQSIANFNDRVDNIIATPTTVSEQEIIDARQDKTSLGANLTSIKNDLAEHKLDYAELTTNEVKFDTTDFSLGHIAVTTGLDSVSDNRIRLNDKISFGIGSKIRVENELNINIHSYNSGNYVANTGWVNEYVVEDNLDFRIVLRYKDDRNIVDIEDMLAKLETTKKEIDGKYLKTNSIDIGKINLFKNDRKVITLPNYGIGVSGFRKYENALSYKVDLLPHEVVELRAENNDRFQIGLRNEVGEIPTGDDVLPLDKIINLQGESEYVFVNDESWKELYFYVKSVNYAITNQKGFIKFNTYELNDDYKISSNSIVSKKDTDNFPEINHQTEIYPVLFGVKMSNERDKSKGYEETPRPIGWLYYNPSTYDLYYASGEPNNLQFLCGWKKSVTWNGISTPAQYRPFITKKGDIIFVWRGDLLGQGSEINPDARQNPIVYPNGDFNNPIEVDLGDRMKPTSWLQNCGADYIYNQNVFLFAEYTRPPHGTCSIWRVTEPVTDPNNWNTVTTLELSGTNDSGLKHYHTINYDTFSGKVFAATGDSDEGAKIYQSDDYGLTWDIVLEGEKKKTRLLNFIFTKDKVYWASDDYQHYFYSVDRDINGVPDFTNITMLYDFTLENHPPTYATCLVNEPYGILFLNREDLITNDEKGIDILFWDIKTETMHNLLTVYSLESNRYSIGQMRAFGFRMEAVSFYQPRGITKTVLGFANPPNHIDILGNTGVEGGISRINNLVMEVKKVGSDYHLNMTAIPI